MIKISNPSIQFEYEGKVYTLKFTIDVASRLQDVWGLKNLNEVMAKTGDMFNKEDLTSFLFACLQEEHPTITRDFVLGIVNNAGVMTIGGIAVDAINASSPGTVASEEKKEASNPQNPQP